MKPALFLITDAYPYGMGENFVDTELQALCRYFDVTVIPRSIGAGPPRPLPEGAVLLNVARPRRFWELLRYGVGFFLSRAGRRELAVILRERKNIPARLYKSLGVYISAGAFMDMLTEQGVAARSRGAVFYSFWYSSAALALSLHRDRLPGAATATRTNGYDLYNERAAGGRQPFRPAADVGLDRVFFPSRMGMRYYFETFGAADSEKYRSLPLGSLNDWGTAPESRDGILRLISCSNVVPLKRVSLIIQALAQLDIPVDWTHVGGGPALESRKAMAAAALSGRDNIRFHFTGAVSHQQVHELYRSRPWDCFITASSTEGMPVSVAEALSYGLPVIATSVGGLPEQLEGTDNFLLSADPTVEEVASAILRLYTMPAAERTALREGNSLRWQRLFDARYCGAQTALTLLALLEERQS